MRIFDPKDQLGNSLLSQADTTKSSVKLEKEMAVGGGAITLTSTDISDIENWELSNASLLTDGQTFNFLPDTTRNADGSLTVDFGAVNGKAVLVLKRADFGGVITIEVKIQQLMTKTLIDSKKQDYDADANIAQWKALGVEAYKSDPLKYPYAATAELYAYTVTNDVVDDCLISMDSLFCRVASSVGEQIIWNADMPSWKYGVEQSIGPYFYPFLSTGRKWIWNGRMPNLVSAVKMFYKCTTLIEFNAELSSVLKNADSMFMVCTGLVSWNGTLGNSLENADSMFYSCSGLTEWTVELPNSLTNVYWMFRFCSGLASFSTPSGTLPNSLTTAHGMFESCSSLREFTPSLAGLTNCEDFDGMFWGCILNKDSIENILGTLPDRTGKTELIIDIGGDDTMEETVKQQLSSLAESVSTAKNWNITLTWNTPPTPTE